MLRRPKKKRKKLMMRKLLIMKKTRTKRRKKKRLLTVKIIMKRSGRTSARTLNLVSLKMHQTEANLLSYSGKSSSISR